MATSKGLIGQLFSFGKKTYVGQELRPILVSANEISISNNKPKITLF